MKDTVERFNYFEKIFFRINMINLGGSAFIAIIMYYLLENVDETGQLFGGFTAVMMVFSFILFVISFIRILKYIFKYRKLDNVLFIWRSIVGFFTSPVAFLIYFILMFVMALSMASCTPT